jgi:hypothetical protein
MPVFRNENEAFQWCDAEGNFIIKEESNIDRIKSNLIIIKECWESAKDNVIKKRWNSTYILYYDVLHLLVESFISLDKIKSRNHLCLFSFICFKHPELELSWNFFEKIRTKRNGINYYATPVSEKDWKEVALQFELYIKLLLGIIEKS